MREAEKLCDRIGVVNKGKLLAEGSKRDLMEEFQEDDLEELFFRLIEQHEKSAASLNGVEGQSNMEGVHGS